MKNKTGLASAGWFQSSLFFSPNPTAQLEHGTWSPEKRNGKQAQFLPFSHAIEASFPVKHSAFQF